MAGRAPHGFEILPGKEAFRVLSPAKINLFLRIVGRRPDGYHDLHSLMCPVSLFDGITCFLGGQAPKVVCPHPHVPEDDTNLALRAAECFMAALGSRQAVAIEIDKRIPVGAGLGGGSSNAAAVLTGLNRFLGDPFTPARLKSMALSLGADVPFFIDGIPALAEGVGDILTPYAGGLPAHLLILYPNLLVPTRVVYENLNLPLTKYEKKINNFVFKESHFDWRSHLWNDLETAAFALYPALGGAKQALMELGACGALMSGSGSALFGIFSDRAAAEKALAKGRAEHKEWQFFRVQVVGGSPSEGMPPG